MTLDLLVRTPDATFRSAGPFRMGCLLLIRSVEEDDSLAPTPEQQEDLDLRLAEADADPDGGVPWDEARERIRQRKR